MTAHGSIEFRAARTGLQVQFSIEREDPEKIAMRSGRRTGPTVITLTKITPRLDGTSGRNGRYHGCSLRHDAPANRTRIPTPRTIRTNNNPHQRFRCDRDAVTYH